MMDKIFRYMPCILYFRSVTFVFLILAFNTFYFLRTSQKTTYLRDGCFPLKDCLLLLLSSSIGNHMISSAIWNK